MAAAAVLRGARSGTSSTRLPIAAVFRRMAQEGVAQGSSTAAAPAAGMGRLLHTGAKLPFGRQAFSSQQRKIVRKEQFSSRRSFMSDDGHDLPCRVVYMLGAMSMGILLPSSIIWKWIKGE